MGWSFSVCLGGNRHGDGRPSEELSNPSSEERPLRSHSSRLVPGGFSGLDRFGLTTLRAGAILDGVRWGAGGKAGRSSLKRRRCVAPVFLRCGALFPERYKANLLDIPMFIIR